MKAVIVELKNDQAAVMTEDGRFLALDINTPGVCELFSDMAALSETGYDSLIGREIILPDSLIEADESEEDELSEDELFDTEPVEDDAGGLTSPEEEENKAAEEDIRRGKDIIPFGKASRRKIRSFRKAAAAVAAAAVLTVTVGGAYTYAQPYGVVSLDADTSSDTSVQYTINRFDRVLSAELVSEDGTGLPADFDMRSVRHKKIGAAISTTLDRIDDADLIVVGANTRNGRHSEMLKEELENELGPRFRKEAKELYLAVASDEETARARTLGTTPGRLLYAHEMLAEDAVNPSEDEQETAQETTPAGGTVPADGASSQQHPASDAPSQNTEDILPAGETGDWADWARRPVMEIREEHDRRMNLMRHGGPEGKAFQNVPKDKDLQEKPEETGAAAAPDSIPISESVENAGRQEEEPVFQAPEDLLDRPDAFDPANRQEIQNGNAGGPHQGISGSGGPQNENSFTDSPGTGIHTPGEGPEGGRPGKQPGRQ